MDSRSLLLKSASLGLLLVGMDLDSCVNSEALPVEVLVQICECGVLKELSWMDSRPIQSKLQLLLHCALSASAAASLLIKLNENSPLCYQDAAFSGLQTLLEHYFTLKNSLEASEKLLFFQGLDGMIRSAIVSSC